MGVRAENMFLESWYSGETQRRLPGVALAPHIHPPRFALDTQPNFTNIGHP